MSRIQVAVNWDKKTVTDDDFIEHAKFYREAFMRIARRAHEEELRDGFDKKAKVRTDNKWNKPLKLVKPYGKVEWYARSSASEALLFTYKSIQKLSPVDTGLYKRSNFVFIGSRLVASNYAELERYLSTHTIDPGKIIRFIDGAPYARMLERFGVTSRNRRTRRGKSRGVYMTKPNGTYYRTYKSVYRKFMGFGNVSFGWFQNGSQGIRFAPPAGMRTTYSALKKNAKFAGRPYVHPTIVIIPFKDGMV